MTKPLGGRSGGFAAVTLEPVAYRPIGVIRTPFAEPAGMPVQAVAATGIAGSIELDPAFAEGLADLVRLNPGQVTATRPDRHAHRSSHPKGRNCVF